MNAERHVRLDTMLVILGVSIFAGLLSGCGSSSSGGASEEKAALPDSAASGEFASVEPETVESAAGEDGADFDRKVIKTADLALTSTDVRETAAKAQVLADRVGGNVLSSQIDRGDGYVSASLVLDVPSSEFEGALEELRGLGETVTADAVRGQDVTEEFVDLKSRERNLLAAEESLLRLYEEARDVEGTLAIQRELTGVRGEIEQLQGRIRYLEQRTASSRISLTVRPAAGASEARSDWDPATTVAGSWSASLSLLQTAATGAISALVFSWWIVPFFFVGAFLWRRSRMRNRGGHGDEPTPDS